ncbi:MAG: TonB-dependent receptor, partial [Polyangiaceae bacterium]
MHHAPRIATTYLGRRRARAFGAVAIGVAMGAVSPGAFAEEGAPPAASSPRTEPPREPPSTDVTAPGSAERAAPPADAPPQDAPNQDAAKRDARRELTVRGARAAPPPRSASQVAISRDVIAATPHQTASDLLALVPGVYITQHSGEGKAHQIFLRGFDAQHGQDVEIFAGGVPVNEVSNVHGQGYADLHFLMPEIVREIDATPGPFDPRQGDFAVAGSIRMHLGYDEPGITAKGTLGSFGTRRLFLAFHPKDTSPETFVAFENYKTDGFGPNRAAQRGSFVGQVVHDLGRGFSLRALASTYAGRFDSAGVVRLSDIESGRIDRFGFYDPKQGGYSARSQLLAELTQTSEKSRFTIAPFAVLRSLELRQNFTGYLQDTQRGGAARLDSDNSQQINGDVMLGATASYRQTLNLLSPRDAVEVGFYGRTDLIDQSQRRLSEVNDAPTETLVDAKVRATDVAGYLDVTLRPLPGLVLRGGIRADALSYATEDGATAGMAGVPSQLRSAQGAHIGKKATLDYTVTPSVHALLSYGEGFRSPQARSLSNGEKTPFVDVTAYEAGVRFADEKRLQGSIAAFYTTLSRDLAFDQATARNEIAPGTRRVGATAELTARPVPWFLASWNITYTRATFTASDARYREGDLLPYVPQVVMRGDVAFKHRLGKIGERDLDGRLGFSTQALARRPLPYAEFGHEIFLVNASAAVRLKEIELGFDAYNLLGANWYDGEF